MAIVINGSGTITGISVGGLPDSIVDAGTLATDSVDSAELIDGAIDAAHLASGVGGKVLQVVTNQVDAGHTPTTSTSYVASLCTGTITPSATSSKILVLMSACGSSEADGRRMYYTLYRGVSNLGTSSGFGEISDNDGRTRSGVHINCLDSPSTTSATTYTLYFKSEDGGGVEMPEGTYTFVTTMMEIAG